MKEKLKERILNLISSPAYMPVTPVQMYDFFSSDEEIDESELWRAIAELEKSYEIVFSKKGKIVSAKEAGYIKGKFYSSARGGFGFVRNGDTEFFIPPAFTRGAIDGDTVVCKKIDIASRFYAKGNEAEIMAVCERGMHEIVGTLRVYHNGKSSVAEVMPDNEKIHLCVRISAKKGLVAEDGDKVICKITEYPKNEYECARGEIISSLGSADSREANYMAVLHENGIITSFSQSTLNEADEVSGEIIDTVGRLDLRDRTVFTIDSAEAKDLDDAISIEITDTGYILGVHIADVSHYVRQGSHLDREAFERGTSVYFTDKVVPMLPKALSNGICSLNEGVDRLTLSCFITLDRNGEIVSSELRNTVINSKMRGVYAELNDILEKGENSKFYQKYAHILDDFYKMMELYSILRRKNDSKGAMELESEESKIILDESGHPVDIIKRERGESERLIEQFMLCANEAVATYLFSASIPCVYRVHDEPDREKIDAFALFAKNLGIDVSPLRSKSKITSMQLQRVLDSARERELFPIASSVLLRSLMKAKYSSVQKAHFGLATELYCHFTSPIRRYPDFSVHRIIKALLGGEINENTVESYERFATLSAERSSENELKAVRAERDIDDLYKCIYMKDRIGEEYTAYISSVTSFGFFAKTENLCEGLVSIDDLGHGFTFDKGNLTLSRGKTVYRLGQEVKITVADADVITRRVRFSLADMPKGGAFVKKDAPVRSMRKNGKEHKSAYHKRTKSSLDKRRKRRK